MSKIKNTKDIAAKHIKVMVHGPAGAGKTRLCGTTGGRPLIISAEGGLLSLKGQDLDAWEVTSIDDLREAYTHLQSGKHKYDWACIDSISEVAEVILSTAKKGVNDPRKAYMEMQDTVTELVRDFRDLPINVYMSAKQDRVKDDVTGQMFFGPSAPGQKLAASLSYFFDEVFTMHTFKDDNGQIQTALQTQRDTQYEAKDRSGKLEFIEEPNLGKIFNKITKE